MGSQVLHLLEEACFELQKPLSLLEDVTFGAEVEWQLAVNPQVDHC